MVLHFSPWEGAPGSKQVWTCVYDTSHLSCHTDHLQNCSYFSWFLGSQRNASDALILISYWCSSSQVRGSRQIEWLSLWKVLNPIFISSKCITLIKFNYTPNFFLLWKMKLVIICASQECMCVCLCVWVGVGHVCEFKMSQIKILDWYQLYTKGRNKEYILPINSVYSNNLNPLISSSKAAPFVRLIPCKFQSYPQICTGQHS